MACDLLKGSHMQDEIGFKPLLRNVAFHKAFWYIKPQATVSHDIHCRMKLALTVEGLCADPVWSQTAMTESRTR